MKRVILLAALAGVAVAVLWTQRLRAQPHTSQTPYIQTPYIQTPYEVKALLPHETSPAQYQQVEQRELDAAAVQGWELVSVMPYIFKNEERGTPQMAPRPMVTQTYPAYFFKRLKTR